MYHYLETVAPSKPEVLHDVLTADEIGYLREYALTALANNDWTRAELNKHPTEAIKLPLERLTGSQQAVISLQQNARATPEYADEIARLADAFTSRGFAESLVCNFYFGQQFTLDIEPHYDNVYFRGGKLVTSEVFTLSGEGGLRIYGHDKSRTDIPLRAGSWSTPGTTFHAGYAEPNVEDPRISIAFL